MQPLNGVLIMLSFLARNPVNYKLKGTCPTPQQPSSVFPENHPALTSTFITAFHYNSEVIGENVFGKDRGGNELNCLRFGILNATKSEVQIIDCDFYDGHMVMTSEGNYNFNLRNTDAHSTCHNQTTNLENFSVWADEKFDFVIFWNCVNDTKLTSHKQVVLVFANYITVEPNWKMEWNDKTVYSRIKNFTHTTLAFSGLKFEDFDVNEKLMTKHETDCGFYNCSSHCSANLTVDGLVDGKSGGFGGPLIFFVVLCFIVIIIFLILL